jgi:hypothetical protein
VIGKVTIHTDFSLPFEEIRSVFQEWLKQSPLWDGRTSGFTVTGASEDSIQVRAIMSARNSFEVYDLECLIREKLIAYLHSHHPECLPRRRVAMQTGDGQPISR